MDYVNTELICWAKIEMRCHHMTATHLHPNPDLELKSLSDLEFHSRHGEPRSLVRPVTEWFVRRMSTPAQTDPRFLDQFFASIAVANRVRTVGVNANRTVLVDGNFHAGSLSGNILAKGKGKKAKGNSKAKLEPCRSALELPFAIRPLPSPYFVFSRISAVAPPDQVFRAFPALSKYTNVC
jgi:hypothetical protein